MLPHQRQYAQLKFRSLVEESTGGEFEKIFHRLMELGHDGYIPIKTHGNLGDLGGDGLCTCCRKLYACYAPETFDVSEVRSKFKSDLAKALINRPGQFDTFVFVYNDQRGMHPVVSGVIAEMAGEVPCGLQQMGPRKMWNETLGLSVRQMEALLQDNIPIEEARFGVGMADVESLLKHLANQRHDVPTIEEMPIVTVHKADFNKLDSYFRGVLTDSRPLVYLVERYYHDGLDTTERDEVAEGFSRYYREMRLNNSSDPDDIFWEMQGYILGQARSKPAREQAGNVILTYFFDECDIFEIPPAGWQPLAQEGIEA